MPGKTGKPAARKPQQTAGSKGRTARAVQQPPRSRATRPAPAPMPQPDPRADWDDEETDDLDYELAEDDADDAAADADADDWDDDETDDDEADDLDDEDDDLIDIDAEIQAEIAAQRRGMRRTPPSAGRPKTYRDPLDGAPALSTLPKAQQQPLRSASAYGGGQAFALPSGTVVMIQPVSVISLLALPENEGGVPNALRDLAASMMGTGSGRRQAAPRNRAEERAQRHGGNGGKGQQRPAQQRSEPEDESLQMVRLIDYICCALVSVPGYLRFVDKPQSQCAQDEQPVSRVWDSDKTAISNYAMRGQQALSSFRP